MNGLLLPVGEQTLETEAKPEGRLDRITWPDLEALLAGGVRTAVIPLGAVEQHGAHLPFATDTLIRLSESRDNMPPALER